MHSANRIPFYLKHEGKNYFAAFFSMLTVVTLCVAMAEPDWFYLHGGRCRTQPENRDFIQTLGVYQFFYIGEFGEDVSVYKYGPGAEDYLYNCVTSKIILVIRLIISLTFFAIGFSLFAFALDLVGSKNRILKSIRQNGLWNIFTVIICVTINGFCFWASKLIEELQTENKISSTSKVLCKFDVSFYLIAAAGGLSVLATACNLLKRHPAHEDEQAEELLEDYDTLFVSEPITLEDNLPAPPTRSSDRDDDGSSTPPPAYTP